MSMGVYILGGSQTDFSRNWAREDLEVYNMFAEVLRDVADAAMSPKSSWSCRKLCGGFIRRAGVDRWFLRAGLPACHASHISA